MKKIFCLVLILSIFCPVTFAAGAEIPEFKIISKNVGEGLENVPPLDKIIIEYNLRIDLVGISATLNGGTELIEKFCVEDGKKIVIYLKEPLQYESTYTLKIEGVKEIYSSQPSPVSSMTFKTKGNVELIEKRVNEASGEFYAKVKNHSSTAKDITFITVAKKKGTGEILKIKIITENISSGGEGEFSYTFSGIKEEYEMFAYGFYDMGTATPLY